MSEIVQHPTSKHRVYLGDNLTRIWSLASNCTSTFCGFTFSALSLDTRGGRQSLIVALSRKIVLLFSGFIR